MTKKPMMILVAGPYRSGTGDDPHRMAENLARLEAVTLKLFRAGHMPMIGEWAALPINQRIACHSRLPLCIASGYIRKQVSSIAFLLKQSGNMRAGQV